MSNNKARIAQTTKFLKWTRKYNGLWQLICESDNEHMNIQMMQMLIKRLAKEELYEIIFVLLEVHKNQEFVKSTKNNLLNDLLISEWRNKNSDEIINRLIMYFE